MPLGRCFERFFSLPIILISAASPFPTGVLLDLNGDFGELFLDQGVAMTRRSLSARHAVEETIWENQAADVRGNWSAGAPRSALNSGPMTLWGGGRA